MYTYRWSIENVQGYPSTTGFNNVVAHISWELEIRDSEDYSVHYIRKSTKLNIDNLSEENFISADVLTDEQLLQWVWDIEGKDNIETQALDELNDLRTPKTDVLVPLNMPNRLGCCPDGTGF